MTQAAAPISDDSVSGFGPTPVYAQLNELVPLDDTWVSSAATPTLSSFQVRLAPLATPSPGSVSVQLNLRKVGSDNVQVAVILLQGSTAIATWTATPGTSFGTASFTLTPAQQALITDYTDLHLQVDVLPLCGGSSLATQLFLTLSHNSGCPCCPTGTYAMNYLNGAWTCFIPTPCSSPLGSWGFNVMFYPNPNPSVCTNYSCDVSFSNGCASPCLNQVDSGCTCLHWTFSCFCDSNVVGGQCGCTGHLSPSQFTFVITP